MNVGRILTYVLLSVFIIQAQTYLDSTASVEDRVQDLLSLMTLDEKIGQMTQTDRGQLSNIENIKTYFLGSILSGGGSAPAVNTPTEWADMYDQFQTKALETRLKIPIIYGIDAVHGNNNVKGAVIFPHNIGMGCTWNTELVKEAARITALEVAGTGIDWTFAPCVAVPCDERWGRTYEGFGETPEITVMMSEPAVKGFQGDTLAADGSIVACAKHFIGDGGTTDGEDQGNTELDEVTLRAIHLPGYLAAIDAGVKTIMASYSSWNGTKVHASKYLLTDLLKNELGFEGFVVSDWNAIDQLNGDFRSKVKQAIHAGIDMAMVPDTYVDFIANLTDLVDKSEIPESRIDDAVARILRVKFEMGLFERPFTNRSLTDSIGAAAHRSVSRQAVRESMVLLKKENSILPLNKSTGKILVAGSKADNIGYQCGGWTISWQGSGGNITDGTTILEGIQNAVSGAVVEFSEDGTGVTDADAAIVVIGETPYAEGNGDDDDLHLKQDDIETVRRVKEAGMPTIVILISGRPMILDNIIHYADVLFTAWLPGTEGDGVADILFGDFQPTGKLTHSWPRSMKQIPINMGDSSYDPLYPYAHGITELADYGSEIAPIVHSALLQKNGKTIELAFSKNMTIMGGESGFTVEINHISVGVDSIAIKAGDSSVFEILLFDEANAGDSLSISYTAGSVTAADGSLLESFYDMDVYNLRNEGSAEQAVPGHIEAENYSSMFGIELEQTTDIGGGNNVGWIDQNDWLEYDLLVADSGNYKMDLRVAANSAAGRVGVVINGVVAKIVDLPITGGWQTWETVSTELPLDSGLQKLKLFAFIGGFNLNWMEFSYTTTITNEPCIPDKFYFYPNYPNPFNPETYFSYHIPIRSKVSITIFDATGRQVDKLVSKLQEAGRHEIKWNGSRFSSGIYMANFEAEGFQSVQKIILLK
ncbi:MAG: glycoside hydrolase family 3 C-terminal domain-containing protein [Calditrichaceae bacterium]|nr:glycoside hydrolase family 3 C-terminal domain-containing protein [Calditrichaceae bacterium]